MRLRTIGAAALAAAPAAVGPGTVSVFRAVRRMSGVLAGATALAACAPAGGARPVATDRVDLPRSYRYAPAASTVRAGTRVTWTNHDVFTHSVHLLDDGDTTMIMKPGDSSSFVFARPGLHRYNCSFHLQMMNGTVEVRAK